MFVVKVEQFEGPLDVLLSLIVDQKLDITAVSLASVADQYLERMSGSAAALRADELADFLVVGAKLLYIKSKLLLPFLTHEDEQEIEELARQLKIYQEFQVASKVLQKILNQHRVSYVRPFSLGKGSEEKLFLPPKKLSLLALRQAFHTLTLLRKPEPPTISISFDAGITLQERIVFLKNLIRHERFSFLGVLRNAPSKTEIIVSFLALLELVKQQVFCISQQGMFGDIIIKRKIV